MKIDGKAIAENIFTDLKKRVVKLKQKGITPHLVIILIGDDPASQAYVRQKVLKGEAIGVKVTVQSLPKAISQDKLLRSLKLLNADKNIHGIIVQRPLPTHIDEKAIDKAVIPQKDVDGFHINSLFDMPLAIAVIRILEEADKDYRKKNIVIIGKGQTGGGPIIKKLRTLNIEPKIVDSKTHNQQLLTRKADILISAVGKPQMVKPDMLRKGVILISIGMHKGKDGKLHGDYDEKEIENIATFYTPTPGGVGPVNVAMLLENIVKAAENFARKFC